MTRYLPIAMGVLVIVGLTIPQIRMSDRFAESNVTAEQFAELLAHVPMDIGDWHGQDLPIEDQVRRVAGVVGRYVNRSYVNKRTGDEVKLWLICGHAKDITGHTPEVCYPSSGFTRRAAQNSLYPMTFPGQPVAEFWTNTFTREDIEGRALVRVFWSWYRPQPDGAIRWEAPEHQRLKYGNARALYKMYFTSLMRDPGETTEQSPCVRFARDVLPVIESALAQKHGDAEPDQATPTTRHADELPAA